MRNRLKYRNKALLASARDESCVACGRNDGTTVWAHSNELAHGKGMGTKAHDLLGLYLCQSCHDWYDRAPDSGAHKRLFFREHYPSTMARIAEKLAAGELRL